MSNRQSAISRYRASEAQAPREDRTFSAHAFNPYPGVDGARTFGSNCRTLGFTFDQATAIFRESDAQQDADGYAAFCEAFNGYRQALHFVGFRGDEYSRAVRVFGRPDFIHRNRDIRFECGGETAPGDVVVFANGYENRVYLNAHNDSECM